MSGGALASAGGVFTWIDWAVVGGYLALTTVLGAKLAGRQATIRDFFLGGRKLPWYAVSGSIIATEISAVTFVGVPAIVFAAGGDFTYLQLGMGTILARVIVGYVFVPAFYEHEIYSPYDYMRERLGPGVQKVVTGLFIVGQLLSQGARVFLTAMVLEVVTEGRFNLHYSIWIIGAIAIGWTILGGIATVVWTDTLLFLLFLTGAVVSLLYMVDLIPGGMGEIVRAGSEANKFRVFDFSLSATAKFTFWTGMIANAWGSLNAYGTDQLIAQRMFCCKDARRARWAIIASSAGLIVTVMMFFVGAGLYAYYLHNPASAVDAAAIAQKSDRVFPIFIVRVLPVGLTGLIVAAIFAAAISSLDSILAALSQTFLSAFYRPWKQRRLAADAKAEPSTDDDAHEVLVSRLMVVFWGLALCGMAYVSVAASRAYPAILNLALSMAGYTGGAMLAAFLLAFLPLNIDDRGIVWSAPMSLIAVFGTAWKSGWATGVTWAACALLLVAWLWTTHRDHARLIRKMPWLIFGLAVTIACHYSLVFEIIGGQPVGPAWPWFIPIGSLVAFVFGYLLADPRPER